MIDTLPVELFHYICSFLVLPRDFVNLVYTSRELRRLTQESEAYFGQIEDSIDKGIQITRVPRECHCWIVHLSDSASWSDRHLEQLPKEIELRSLVLKSGIPQRQKLSVHLTTKAFIKLQRLHISNCKVSMETDIFSALHFLSSLTLEKSFVSTRFLQEVLQSSCALKSLQVFRCCVSREALHEEWVTSKHLRYVSFANSDVSTIVLGEILESLQNVEVLDLSSMDEVDDTLIEYVAFMPMARTLRKLSVRLCRLLHIETIEEFVSEVSSLESLDLTGLGPLEDPRKRQIFRGELTNSLAIQQKTKRIEVLY